nr:Zn-dependent hydrolase [Pseudoalteromonas denitrificans]
MTVLAIITASLLSGCSDNTEVDTIKSSIQFIGDRERLNIYHPVDLKTDLTSLTDNQRQMLAVLIDASKIMDDLFWKQAFGNNKDEFLSKIDDSDVRKFAEINYGSWDRLAGDAPFLTNIENKRHGAEFYPADMTKNDYESANLKGNSLYTIVSRSKEGKLITIPYSEAYNDELKRASALLRKASKLAENKEFSEYLNLRADALLSDNYQPSDFAWMDMKTNQIDVVIGPIETYEDQLFGYRAAFESYVLVKDLEWSEKLAKFAAYLPELQKGLPVAEQYKPKMSGSSADINAYDVIYYAGHSNAGGKTIAINLPNDEEVQLKKGTRRLQLKNAMKAKFDHILAPISEQLISPESRNNVTFDAFFTNTMFHEVAHGLGIKSVINSDTTVSKALKEYASALEEGKADILGLYMVTQLLDKGVLTEGKLKDYYTTFLAGIFRSVRFGASSAHGKANMIRFNYFEAKGAFNRDNNGLYSVNMEKMRDAMSSLSTLILTLQGNGDYKGVGKLFSESGVIKKQLADDLNRLTKAKIPVDITFNQGKSVLGIQ